MPTYGGICENCIYFNWESEDWTCKAFPNGIPMEFLSGELFHIFPYEGDNGIQFDPIDDEAEELARFVMGCEIVLDKDQEEQIDKEKFLGTADEFEFIGMEDDIEILPPQEPKQIKKIVKENPMNCSEPKHSIKSGNIGPQNEQDPPFMARMRFHQSWYRANVLGVPCGTGPSPNDTRKIGNMLTQESGAQGLNFLTQQNFEVVKDRLKDKRGVVDEFRLLCNMLSSQPMCFNLFAPLVVDHSLASRVCKQLLPNEVKKVIDVKIEYAPEPACEYLDDRTAFDAFVEFVRPDTKRGFVGIETKLTEPFSPKDYDGPAYRRWSERPDSPWPKEAWSSLSNIRYNQLWRDHLLAVAMRHHPKSSYASGFLMLVRHPDDKQCAKTVKAYNKLLKPEDNSFLDYPLNELVHLMECALLDTSCQSWLAKFRRRYLDLSLSEEEWQRWKAHRSG